MKAVVLSEFGGPEKLVQKEMDLPRAGHREVLIAVKACGVCHFDMVVRTGLRSKAKLPLILGHEIAGEIVEVGPDVDSFTPGDRVTCITRVTCRTCQFCRTGRETLCVKGQKLLGLDLDGGYADAFVLPASLVCRLPVEVSFEEASVAACVLGATFSSVRDKCRVGLGDDVLITGAGGGLGVHAIQVARLCGGRVIAVTSTEAKADFLRELGAHEVVVSPDLNFSQAVRRLTDGKGVDVVIENLGSTTFPASLKSIANGGRLVFVGEMTGNPVALNPAVAILKEITMFASQNATMELLSEILGLVAQKRIRPVVTERFPLSDAGRVHQLLMDRKTVGRVVLTP